MSSAGARATAIWSSTCDGTRARSVAADLADAERHHRALEVGFVTAQGAVDEARAAAQARLVLDPSFTVRRYRADVFSDNPNYIAWRERMYQGMHMAGLPEG